MVNKVHRDGESQKRFGYRSATTSQNKNKQTPLSHGYHLEDYDRQCMYLHYYGDEDKPFYVGQGTLTNIIRGGRGGSLGSGSNNPNAKPVIQLNIYGEFIKEWGSVIEAAKALQIDSSAIAKCCRHVPKYKRAGGYVWEYKENYGD